MLYGGLSSLPLIFATSTNMRMRLKLASMWVSARRLEIRPHLSDVG